MVPTCVLRRKRKIASYVCNSLKIKEGTLHTNLKEKSTPSVVSKEIEDLLGVECHPSTVSSNPQPMTEVNASDPL